MTKQELRQKIKEKRSGITAEQKKALDAAIVQRISSSEVFASASSLLIYAPAKGEINLLPLVRLARERGIEMSAAVVPGVTVNCDPMKLTQVFYNLMDNAIKYCDSGGEIRMMLHRGRRVVLTVENTYAAVSELELGRLFDRFYRADKARKFTGGYGVGLSMAKAIAENHKGEITAYKKDSTHIGFKVVL